MSDRRTSTSTLPYIGLDAAGGMCAATQSQARFMQAADINTAREAASAGPCAA